MKKALLILLVLPLMALGQEEERGRIMAFMEFTVKQGHSAQFEDGMKKLKACYNDNGGEDGWTVWKRVQGEGSVYNVVSAMDNWAEMDEVDEGWKGCYNIIRNFTAPHVEKVKRSFARQLPKWSQKNHEGPHKLVQVSSFIVNNNTLFSEAIKEYIDIMTEMDEDLSGYWSYSMGVGKDGADYTLASFYKDYAALDETSNLFEKYEKANGKKKADEMRDRMKKAGEKWSEAIEDSWGYIWERKPELSN
ncbi:hypothetical protein GCM10011312_25890 [Planktosalinus lacus]|uniref:Uncharacterized protein n=2 Tax=Planktosalinus lacus TaxID=1526573 RepID=A0A8J2Y8C8_9FLAO|nr:hypothetical protein GCM10011312_25890 [Planktosalinus lacus]